MDGSTKKSVEVEAREEAKLKAQAEAKKNAEEVAKLKAEVETRKKAEEDAKIKAENEAKIKAEAEKKKKAEEQARIEVSHMYVFQDWRIYIIIDQQHWIKTPFFYRNPLNKTRKKHANKLQ